MARIKISFVLSTKKLCESDDNLQEPFQVIFTDGRLRGIMALGFPAIYTFSNTIASLPYLSS